MRTRALRIVVITIACALLLAMNASGADPKVVNVPAGDLADALESLAKQCGVDVIYPSAQLKGLKTAGVRGALEPLEAFRKLLEGTPLIVTQKDGAILIALPPDASNSEARETSPTSTTSSGMHRDDDEELIGAIIQEIVGTAQQRAERHIDVLHSVDIHLDAVPYGSGHHGFPQFALELDSFDVQRIEALRGQQGANIDESAPARVALARSRAVGLVLLRAF
jgi:hypothetical protein